MADENMIEIPQGRRELLKKLGIAAGAVAWATPIVQTITTAAASAAQGNGYGHGGESQATTSRGVKGGTCHDISHLDLVITRGGTTKYGIAWSSSEGWHTHPTGGGGSTHCLALTSGWVAAPASVFNGFPTPTGSVSTSFRVTLPADVTVVNAWSFAGNECQPATNVGGKTWQFDRWCQGATTTTTALTTTTTTRPTTTTTTTRPSSTTSSTTTTTRPTTTTTRSGGGTVGGGSGSACDEIQAAKTRRINGAGTQQNGYTYSTKAGDGSGTTTRGLKGGTCHDISHLDLVIMRGGNTKYGIAWDSASGWHTHPNGGGGSTHCLALASGWVAAPSSVFNGFPTPSGSVSTSYRVTLPVDVTVVSAWSFAGNECQPASNLGGNSWQFDRWCDGAATTTTTTTRPATTTTSTTTTSTTRPTTTTTSTSTTTTSTTRPTTTSSSTTSSSTTSTTRATTTSSTQPTTSTTMTGGGGKGAGSGDCNGSPQPGKDISHMDWVLCRSGSGGTCSDRYGVQYEFGAGWGAHPSGPTTSQHCLAGLNWRVPPSTFSFAGFGNAVSLGGGSYRITLPVDVTVFEAYSKCGQICRRATNLGGNTWRFDPC